MHETKPKEDLMQFHIENMTCGGCVRSVTKAIHDLDPAARISADPATRRIDVQTTIPRDTVSSALAGAGFAAN
jgi:copper chaperone